ncbi:tyrosine-type recombinase/integrase [Corynebacterium heidelbergense]|uniref:Site-specific integrase n=1 Tax=Corynebacterium heidelbergense TaxID=2055947 RepID=A0A364VE02_9CORY|nr:site-specific integrase [Corynebacterium heidelbergense]RAV34873.1 site-specific integrase [Corynebacterium heidelbergense]WCZ36008.1 Tyrosine recombinase XerC [Corynebacterium heidelbergense]
MASIKRYKNAAGKTLWRVQYRDPQGKSRTKQPFQTKTAAEAWAATNTTALTQGTWINPERQRTTIKHLWDTWWPSQRHLAASSSRAIETSWATHVQPAWQHAEVGSVTTETAQRWVDKLAAQRSPSTVQRAHGILKTLLEEAVRYGYITANPCASTRVPARQRRAVVTLTKQQVEDLAATSRRFPELLLFLGYTGARWGEAAALTVGDLDLARGRARITKSATTIGGKAQIGTTKTRASRTIAIPKRVAEALAPVVASKRPDALVWSNQDGGPLTTPSRRSWFHTAVDRCMAADPTFPPITPHDLRHAAASIMIADGHSVLLVQRQLGHASAKMTLDTYAHLFDRELDALSG